MATARVRRLLRAIERICVLAGVGALAWLYASWHEAAVYEVSAREWLRAPIVSPALPDGAAGSEARRSPSGPDAAVRGWAVVEPPGGSLAGPDGLVGLLSIPRLGLSAPILSDDSDQTLRIATGHLPDTPLPWQSGNAAIAGHRDTFFRPLEDVRVGDDVQVLTVHGMLRYRVVQTVVVDPSEVWVLQPWGGIHLTLVTCYPFTYIGSAPQRFVVHAERIALDPPTYRRALHAAPGQP